MNSTFGSKPSHNLATAWHDNALAAIEPEGVAVAEGLVEASEAHTDYDFTLESLRLRQHFPVPNNPVTSSVMQSLSLFGKFRSETLNIWTEEGGDIRATHKFLSSEIEIIMQDTCISEIATFPSIIMDVTALLLSAGTEAMNSNHPAIIRIKDILKSVNVKSYGDKRAKIAADINRSINILNSISVNYKDTSNSKMRKSKSISGNLVRLTPITELRDGEPYVDCWSLKLGAWSDVFLTHDKRRGVNWTTTMPPALLEFDWRPQRANEGMAKNIGLLVRVFPGGTTIFTESQQRLRVQNLLMLIGEWPAPSLRKRDWARRTRARLESALLLLEEKGVFTKAQYERAPPRPYSWWVQEWLQSNLVFSTHPQPISTVSGE
ncbi:MAG: hypothetical protein EOM37_10440 [Proteobacteria bacterium]|nr:hypothetical protein [Pseudomonadota bacterium]